MQTAQIRKTGPSTSTCKEKRFQLCLQPKLKSVFRLLKPKTCIKMTENSFISISLHQAACLSNVRLSTSISYDFFLHTYSIWYSIKELGKRCVNKYYCNIENSKKKKTTEFEFFSPFSSTSVIPQPQAVSRLKLWQAGRTKGTKQAWPQLR